MKNTFLPVILLISTVYVCKAQKVEVWNNVPVIMEAYAHKVSPDGSFTSGEALGAEASWARDNSTGEFYIFPNSTCGDGNNITKKHIIVGTNKTYMKGTFLLPENGGSSFLIPSLQKYGESYVHGINWDGTRLVGFMSNGADVNVDETNPDNHKMSYVPFYCDVNPETLDVSEPIFLPAPPKDFFGMTPQYCTAFWISDDAKTILGQVIDNSGFFIYPVVYKQSGDGTWSYSLPSEKLFNPNGLPIPKYPVPAIAQPQPENYIGNPEFKALFLEMWDAYISGESDINPYLLLDPAEAGPDALMTQEEWQDYQEALIIYESYYYSEYEELVNKYYEDYSRFIAQSTNFFQSSMAMNREGTLIGQTKEVTRFSGITPVTYKNPVIFNLTDDSYKIYGGEYDELEITQILPDGTLLGVTTKPSQSTPDITPQHSYICPPGHSDFITIEDYLKDSNPEYYQWYQDYLNHDVPIGTDEFGKIIYIDLTVTGLVSASDDLSFIAGAVDGWSWDLNSGNYFTYLFDNVKKSEAGIEDLRQDEDGLIKVFNLQGIKVLESKQIDAVKSLPAGIYVINGKKVFIK